MTIEAKTLHVKNVKFSVIIKTEIKVCLIRTCKKELAGL